MLKLRGVIAGCALAIGVLAGCAGNSTSSTRVIEPKAAPSEIAGWERVSSPSEKFAVLMPGAPKRSVVNKGVVKAKVTMFQKGRTAFAVIVADYQESGYSAAEAGKLDSEKVLSSTIKGFVESSKGSVSAQKDIALQGQPGKEFMVTMAAQGAQSKTRVYLVQGKIYQVFVVAPTAQFSNKDADVFLNSFTLLK